MPGPLAKKPPLSVTLVSQNASTVERLETYLKEAGLIGNSTRAIDRLLEMTPPSAAAVIAFPDEFDPDVALKALHAAKRRRVEVLFVVVTSEPQRFEELAPGGHGEASVVILAKPAWAWTILDTIRTKLEPRPADLRSKPEK